MEDSMVMSISPDMFRLYEADYFFDQYQHHCGSPEHHDNYFQWISYADVFVIMLTSMEALVSEQIKTQLRDSNIFLLIKALRNITVHGAVFPAPNANTVARDIYLKTGSESAKWVEPKLLIDRTLDAFFQRLTTMPEHLRKNETKTIDGARTFFDEWKQEHGQEILLSEVFEKALNEVSVISGITLNR